MLIYQLTLHILYKHFLKVYLMNQKRKIINLFNIYTTISVCISIAAWLVVTLGFVNIPQDIINGIGPFDIAMGSIIYGLGLANVWTLSRIKIFNSDLFLVYLSSQVLALILSFAQQGWLFFPAAGSQGTIPAMVISVGMYFYLWNKAKKETCTISWLCHLGILNKLGLSQVS